MAELSFAGTVVLVVDDEASLRKRLAAFFTARGAEVAQAGSLAEAKRLAAELPPDVALLDVHLPDGLGTSLLGERVFPPTTSVLVMTAEGGIAGAVEAMRLGAADYFVKPFEFDELPLRLARVRRSRERARADEFRREQTGGTAGEFIFGPALEPLRLHLERILAADRRVQGVPPPVLIEGETGTGKTSLARWLHRRGPRAEGPLIEVNCSALPEALAESELFGHERGAFTDAREARLGLFEAADGGTLFLDELPSLSPAVQAKLLTAIEDGTVRRVGAARPRRVDVRIIAAASQDLRARVAAGAFRDDLLHRLDLFRLRLPPLRERGDDVIALARQLAARTAQRYGRPPPEIPPEGERRLRAHRWPGNVRELSHEIERAVVFEEGRALGFEQLGAVGDGPPAWLAPGWRIPNEGFALESVIEELIRRALAQSDQNVSAAARLLGVTRDFLRYRLKTADPEGDSQGG